MKKIHATPFAALLASFAIGALPVAADLLVYEPFNYGPAGDGTRADNALLEGRPDFSEGDGDVDATGLGGTWGDSTAVTASSDLFLASGSLLFGDLAISGNHVRGDTNLNNDIFSRPITASLDAGGELWISFLANKLQNNFSAAREGIGITSGALNSAQFDNVNPAGLHGFGIAPIGNGTAWTAYGWDGTAAVVGSESFSVPTNGSQTNLLIGRVQYGAGTDGADVFTVYHYDRAFVDGNITANPDNLVTITSIEVDVDETLLNTLVLTRQVNTAFDEIRIGTTLADVTPGGGGPGPVDHFLISAISSPQTVGEPITGITLTARDASNNTAIGFNGTVTFGGTGGFGGTSDSFTAGVLSGVSVTPTVAGTDLTLTVDDGAGQTGTTTIATIESAATGYDTWSGGSAPDEDDNADGVENGVAWALGAADPDENAIGLLPTLDNTSDPTSMIFSYNRADPANDDPNTSITVEYGTNLVGWTTAVNGPDVVITETPGSPTDAVEVKLDRELAVDGKLFVRLKVEVTP